MLLVSNFEQKLKKQFMLVTSKFDNFYFFVKNIRKIAFTF